MRVLPRELTLLAVLLAAADLEAQTVTVHLGLASASILDRGDHPVFGERNSYLTGGQPDHSGCRHDSLPHRSDLFASVSPVVGRGCRDGFGDRVVARVHRSARHDSGGIIPAPWPRGRDHWSEGTLLFHESGARCAQVQCALRRLPA